MGMAASQAMLLQLTSRKNTIGRELTCLSNQKVSLSRDMQRISREYQAALSDKILKWSNNGGVSYVDLSYQNLMKPSTMNQNNPYLLTDQSGRIIVDSQYEKYAQMISENGGSGDWESVRTEVLSELTGIDAGTIETADAFQKTIWEKENIINQKIDEEVEMPTDNGSTNKFLEYTGLASTGIGSGFTEGKNWAEAYNKGGKINLGGAGVAEANLKKVLDTIYAGLEPFLVDDASKKALKDGCDTFLNDNKIRLQGNDAENKTSLEADYTAIGGSSKNYTVDVKNLIDQIMCNVPKITTNNGNQEWVWAEIKDPGYQEWEKNHKIWEQELENAKKDLDNTTKNNNQLLTSDQEKLIAFYDAIFSAIADRGWVTNDQVNDTDYLNQMLQNGLYTLTTVDRDGEFNEEGQYIWDNNYKTDIASNFKNVFPVSNTDAREEALVEYEYEKSIINAKESKIDTRMKNLETEQAAINQMIQGIEQVKNDNIDRTMNIFA